jgi:integrase
MTELPQILDSLESINMNKKIKIRAKKGDKQNRWSLFLDHYYNSKHNFTFPKIYIVGTAKSRNDDKLQLKLIQELRDEKERQLIQDEHSFELKNMKGKVNFIKYFENVAFEKSNLTTYHASVQLLKSFAGENLTFDSVNEKLCEDFRDYILTRVTQVTGKTYFAVFKATLNRAVREKIIKSNPAINYSIKTIETKREFLTEEELKLFISSPTDKTDIKNAFVFSTQTSLRLGDIRNLKFTDINEGYIFIRQEKTKGISRNKLSNLALRILEE